MSTAFAAAQARLGASALGRLGNASAQVLPGTNTVDGIFTERAVEAQMGGAGFLTRSVDFVCSIADAVANAIVKGTQLIIKGTTYEVSLRTDDHDLNQSKLDLVLP